jgi:hypothetical protein
MKKSEILQSYSLTKLDETTVFIKSREFDFAYTKADSVVKDEYKGRYRYFGGLQCNYHKESPEYKNLESWLCEIAEFALGIKIKVNNGKEI